MHLPIVAGILTLMLHQMPDAGECAGVLGKNEFVQCALTRNLDLKRSRLDLDSLAGRRITASTWLPTRPVVAASAAHRRAMGTVVGESRSLNWYLTLSQEIEIAGQRSARLDEVDALVAAQVRRVAAIERETTALALSLYYRYLALQQQADVAARGVKVATSITALADARLQVALLSPLERNLAQAEAAKLTIIKLDTEREIAGTLADIRAFLAVSDGDALNIEGSLKDNDFTEAEISEATLIARALVLRGEVAAAEAERLALDAQISLLRRARVPNVTLSFIAQQDGFNERVLGGGVSLPIPLPSPLVPNNAGEISQAQARRTQADLDVERIRRRVQREVQRAFADERSREAARKALPADVVERARLDLESLSDAVGARQFSVRDAIIFQRNLLELLRTDIETQFQHHLAHTELLRAAGLPLTGEDP